MSKTKLLNLKQYQKAQTLRHFDRLSAGWLSAGWLSAGWLSAGKLRAGKQRLSTMGRSCAFGTKKALATEVSEDAEKR